MRKAKRHRGLPRGAHRVRIEVKPDARNWCVTVDGTPVELADADKTYKTLALQIAVQVAHRLERAGGFASVRVHDRRGRFQREMTYPRSSDPMPPRG